MVIKVGGDQELEAAFTGAYSRVRTTLHFA